MTTAEGGATREPSTVVVWLTHAMPALCVITLLACIPSWLGWTSIDAATFWISFSGTVTLISAGLHAASGRMCVACTRQVPLDPQAAVDKHGWALFAAHVAGRRPLYTWLWLLGLLALGSTARHVTGIPLFYMPWDVVFVAMCYSQWRHHYLQPWCPRCRGDWGDGGEPELVPDPDPAEKATR